MTTGPRTIADLGEFGLIDRLLAVLPPARGDTIVGAGDDDTAVLRLPGGRLQLATLDTLVAGVHFRADAISPGDLGRRLAAVNLSDIAAMGGRPTHALAGLVAPTDLAADYAVAIVRGLASALREHGADLVGGNVARGEGLVLDLALLGEVDEERLLLRSGARPGDRVLVTGALGGAAAARALSDRPDGTPVPDVDPLLLEAARRRLRAPEARLNVAGRLGPLGATAAIDVSDGLAADLGHVCDRSGVGMELHAAAVPVDPAALAIGEAIGADARAWALGGGEDYELVVTAPEPAVPGLRRSAEESGVPLTAIGRIRSDGARFVAWPDGSRSELEGGWRHFG